MHVSPSSPVARLSRAAFPTPRHVAGSVSVQRAANEVAGAFIGAATDGLGVAASTLVHLPRAVHTRSGDALRASSDGRTRLLALARVPADVVVLSIVGTAWAAAFGFVNGARDASDHGLAESVRRRLQDVRAANRFIHDWASTPISRTP